ncbi:histidine-type phosphatase [Aeromicrobium sp.]|uniref:histidine-type phosphatase n=1 Tax=Aeromicrobium sp. TaxID=1871063 RepID=UPI003C5CE3A8
MLKIISLVVALLTSVSAAQASQVSDSRHYSNQTPYGNPSSTPIMQPPSGYELVLLETIGRHGSRSQTSDDGERRALSVWRAASRKGALTKNGKRFDDDLAAFQKVERRVGYGKLSAIGAIEWSGIGRRTAANYREFWNRAVAAGDAVAFTSSPIHRTKQSSAALRSGLDAAAPGLDLQPRATDPGLLVVNGSTAAGRAAIKRAHRTNAVRRAADHVLRRLYTRRYVDGLTNPVGKALDIYSLYSIAPGLRGETALTFSRYVPVADAKVLGYAKDAKNFYRYGPGVAGQTNSYRQVRPLLQDFFAQIDQRLAGGRTAAVFRIGHGETTMPFAALIKAPGSQTQVPRNRTYSYGSNPWRGFVAGRMAGNIEWALYRDASGDALVTMRYNEQPAKFSSRCSPMSPGSYFYSVSSLKRCLG